MNAARSLEPAPSAPLWTLLRVRRPYPGLYETATDEALAKARALGDDAAAEVVSGILDADEPGGDRKTAERAADVACELRLAGAAPALVRRLERLSEYDAVAHAALRALEAMPVAATGPLLEAFARCTDPADRVLRAAALARAGVRDGRVRVRLTGMLAEDPKLAADLLRGHGDRDALPALVAALDRLELLPHGAEGELRRCEEVVTIVQAIWGLAGKVSKAQQAKFDVAWERSGELWLGSSSEVERFVGGA